MGSATLTPETEQWYEFREDSDGRWTFYNTDTDPSTHTHSNIYIYLYVHTYTYKCTQIYIYVYVYIYMYTHIQYMYMYIWRVWGRVGQCVSERERKTERKGLPT